MTARQFTTPPQARFVLTEKGKTVHIADAGSALTRCGWPIAADADADDVLWFTVCQTCRGDEQ